jgi:hypothetical protein
MKELTAKLKLLALGIFDDESLDLDSILTADDFIDVVKANQFQII